MKEREEERESACVRVSVCACVSACVCMLLSKQRVKERAENRNLDFTLIKFAPILDLNQKQ